LQVTGLSVFSDLGPMIVLLAFLGQAWRSLRFYGRRSFLTMLGMAWGITTLVMLHAYGVEFEKLVRAGFETFGTKLLVVSGGRTSEQAGGERTGRPIRLQLEDMEYVKATVPLVRDASPQVDQEYLLSYGPRSQKFRVYGVYRVYGRMRRMETGEGRWLNEADEMQRARVAVLGADLKERLFADRPASGESIRIAGISFDVIGVLRKKVGFAGDEDNRVLFIPFSAMALLRSTRYIEFVAELQHGPVHKNAVKQIRARLGERLAFRPTDERALGVWDAEQDMDEIRIITGMLKVMLAVIGAITLGIGGVGVTNIMLVSVMQRTREIGLQRSLGARRRQVMAQFLAEALLLTFAGGALGIALSYFIAWMVPPLPLWSALADNVGSEGDIVLRIGWQTLLLTTGVLCAVGLAAGLWPALRASRLDPVEALRYE